MFPVTIRIVLLACIVSFFEAVSLEKAVNYQYQRISRHHNDENIEDINLISFQSHLGGGGHDGNHNIINEFSQNFISKGHSERQKINDQPLKDFLFLTNQFTTSIDNKCTFGKVYQKCLKDAPSKTNQFDEVIVRSQIDTVLESTSPENESSICDTECLISIVCEKYGNKMQKSGQRLIEHIERLYPKTTGKNIGYFSSYSGESLPDKLHALTCFVKAVSICSSDLEETSIEKSVPSVKLVTADYQESFPPSQRPEYPDQNLQSRLMKLTKKALSMSSKTGSAVKEGTIDTAGKVKGGVSDVGLRIKEVAIDARQAVHTESKKAVDTIGRESQKFASKTDKETRRLASNVSQDKRSVAANAGKFTWLASLLGRRTNRGDSFVNRRSNGRSPLNDFQNDDLFKCILKATSSLNIPGQVVESLKQSASRGWGLARRVAFKKNKRKFESPNGSTQKSPTLTVENLVKQDRMQNFGKEVKDCLKFFDHDEEGNLRINQRYTSRATETIIKWYPPAALALGTARAITKNVTMKKDEKGNFTDYKINQEGLMKDLAWAVVMASPVGRTLEAADKLSTIARTVTGSRP